MQCVIIARVRPLLLAVVLSLVAVPSVGAAAGKPVGEATETEEAAARDAFVSAKEHYDAGRFEPALAGFLKSYDIVRSPNSHLMVARSLLELGRHVEAYHHMRATMLEAEAVTKDHPGLAAKYEQTLATAKALTAELRQKVGLVIVELAGATALPADATLRVRGRAITDLTTPVVVEPGLVDVSLRTSDGVREVTRSVPAGGEARVTLELPGKNAPAPVLPDPEGDTEVSVPAGLAYGAAALGAAGFVVFGVFGGLTLSTFGELEDDCPNGVCPADKQSALDDGRAFQVVANVGLVVGVSGAVASLALLLFDIASPSTAILRPTPNGLALGGDF